MDETRLRHIWQNRQRPIRIAPLGPALEWLMQHRLAKRVRQVGQFAAVWDECIPDYLRQHTALVGLKGGVVTVAVDSAPHRYQLHTLLASGLLDAIRQRYGGPIDRIKLVPGQCDFLEMPDTPRTQA